MSQIINFSAKEGSTIKGNDIKQTNSKDNSVKFEIKHYAIAAGSGFVGGVLASILANIITHCFIK